MGSEDKLLDYKRDKMYSYYQDLVSKIFELLS